MNDCTYSNNKTPEFTKETLEEMKKLLQEFSPAGDEDEPFAKFMATKGFDYKEDYMVIPKTLVKEVKHPGLGILPIIPPYVKISKHVDKIILFKGRYQSLKPIEWNWDRRKENNNENR